ncbi:hypothetical protein [Intrasporangium sp. DVR]|uniref:hypothetical protein n=1 Tax=Intrasporangium sp. DVR TaxID=3127867 RepID=UPI00313A5DA7
MSQTGNDDRFVNPTVGKKFWIKHAYDVLVETAGQHNAVITYGELAEEVQRRSGLRTTAAMRTWVGELLKMVAQANHLRGEPALTALVVHKQDGQVGAGYDEVLRLEGAAVSDPHERELHAASARLQCYRHWCDDVPADAEPTLATPRRPAGTTTSGSRPPAGRATVTARSAPRSRSHEERRGGVCPTCFMEMPVAGPCPNCS